VPNLLPFLRSEAARVQSGLAFINEDRATLDRWAISIAVALVLHGTIAAAVLTWHSVIVPERQAAPFLIDLLPLPAAPAAEQSQPERPQSVSQSAAAAAGSAQTPPPASERVITNAPELTAPRTPARSADDGAANGAESRIDSGGGGAAAHAGSNGTPDSAVDANPLPSGGMNAMPLDTSITVMPGLYGKKAGGGMAQKKKQTVIFRPLKRPALQSGQSEHAHNLSPATANAVTRTNAVGAHVQDRVRAAFARAGSHGEIKNAIGGAAAPGPGGVNTNAAEGVAVNSVGVTVHVHPGIPGTNTAEPKTGPVEPVASAGTMNHSVVNGHDMIRPGSAAGAIGGPAKNTTGVLSGSMFHLRHP